MENVTDGIGKHTFFFFSITMPFLGPFLRSNRRSSSVIKSFRSLSGTASSDQHMQTPSARVDIYMRILNENHFGSERHLCR